MKNEAMQFHRLCAEAEQILARETDGEQVIVLLAAGDDLHHLVNHNITGGDTSEESSFLALLREQTDGEVRALVCMWRQGGCLDVPSMHFRQGLMALSPANGAALVLLRGEDRLIAKKLEQLMP